MIYLQTSHADDANVYCLTLCKTTSGGLLDR